MWHKSHNPHHHNVFDRTARLILNGYFELIQMVYYDTASMWQCFVIQPLTLTWRVADPRRRAPFALQLCTSLSDAAKQMSIHIGALSQCASRFWGSTWWRSANLDACRVFQRATFFTRAIRTRDWSQIKTCFLTAHFFFWPFILRCV